MTGREEMIETIRLWVNTMRVAVPEWGPGFDESFREGYRYALLDLEDVLGTL